MKNICCILLALPLFGLSQNLSQNDRSIVAGTKKIIHSAILKEDREVWVYIPASFAAGSQTHYPVMYLLDGPSFFHPVTGMVQYLSSTGKMPEMIVVGIANTNRVRDLTPTHSIHWSDGEEDAAALGFSGGGEKFISFIEHELIPYVDAVYKTAPYRMFVGHSLGGLTVLNSLLNHTSLFTSYVAIDPSVWWDNQALMKKAAQLLPNKDLGNKSLYYASANTMSKSIDTFLVMQDTTRGNIHVRNNLQFRQLLLESKNSSLLWRWKFYPEDNHSSIPLIATYDALRYLFKGYELDKDMNDTSITVDYIKTHYLTVSRLLHYKVLPSQATVNFLGYNFLSGKNYSKAHRFFSLNLENFPSSANAYDSMGDFYLEIKDKKKAAEMYLKALSLEELPSTRKKLEQLKLNERR